MSLTRKEYDGGHRTVTLESCPFCGCELGERFPDHIENSRECREVALTRLGELSSGTHRREIESRENEREGREKESGTVQVTL